MSFFPKPFLAYILSLISVLCFLVSPVAAQNAAQLSPEGWLMLQELTTEGIDPKASPTANKNLPPGLPKRLQAWPLTQSETGLRVGVILEWAQAPDVAALSRLDIQASEATTGLQTARVPLTSLDDLLQVPGLLRVQVNYKGKTQLDAGRRDVGGDQVFAGTGLPQPYTGAGVIVGIVDNGFDYTHPVFRHAVTGQSRIVRA